MYVEPSLNSMSKYLSKDQTNECVMFDLNKMDHIFEKYEKNDDSSSESSQNSYLENRMGLNLNAWSTPLSSFKTITTPSSAKMFTVGNKIYFCYNQNVRANKQFSQEIGLQFIAILDISEFEFEQWNIFCSNL